LFAISLSVLAETPPVNQQLNIQNALKNAFEDLMPSAEERKHFDLEVVPSPLSFVSDYQGAIVQIDREKLKGFVKFSGTDALCVSVRAEPACGACRDAQADVQRWFTGRLERRGFAVKPGPALTDDAPLRFEDYAVRAADSQCAGLAYLEIKEERSADEDEDATDVKVRLSGTLMLGNKQKCRAQSVGAIPKAQAADYKDALSKAMTKLLSAQTADLYSQLYAMQSSGASKLAGDEKYLRVQGITGFQSYVQAKQAVQAALPELKLEERIISPGAFQFAVSGVALGEVARVIRGLAAPKMVVQQVTPDEVVVDLK
jgi:hypothetical protein